jgi:phosphoribosylglycinamide formyltransferase-1
MTRHATCRATIPPMPGARQALSIVVLISGRGSNLLAIIEAMQRGELPVDIRAVICNRRDAPGIQFARRAGIESVVIEHAGYADRDAFDAALRTTIDALDPGLVVLAGFMRLLTPDFVRHFRGRLINIHPSLLPEFPGLDTHRRVLDAGCRESGATVHFVTEEVDGGPAFLQVRVPVLATDSAQTLAQRVLAEEHRLYPLAIRWYAEGRVSLDAGGRVLLDGKPLAAPRVIDSTAHNPP